MTAPVPTLHQLSDVAAVKRLLASVQSLAPEDTCLLIEDAVTAAAALAECLPKMQLFGLQIDAETAGVELISGVHWLDDAQWLALIDRHPRCVLW